MNNTMKPFCLLGVFLLLSIAELKAATSVSQRSCTLRNLTVTVDDHLRLYFDGNEVTNLPNSNSSFVPDIVNLPCTTRLIAINGTNDPKRQVAGIRASTDDEYVLTNSSWKCSNVSQLDWETIDFDDSTWVSAIEYYNRSEYNWTYVPGIRPNAAWIWLRQWNYMVNSTYEEMDMEVYCRKRLDPNICDISNPCLFGSTCIQQPNVGYECICAPGYTGQNCSTVINYCESDPCLSEGTCLPIINGYVCQCPPGYTGDHCEYVINNCASLPCLNGGTCLTNINFYECECPLEWTGARCHILRNPCDDRECANGGTCLNNCGLAQCICRPGWTGTLCFDFTEPCASNPCQNGGLCEETENGFICTCPPSLTGQYCEQIIDLCASNPCMSGSTCAFDCSGYHCFCSDGWTGLNCETLIDACIPNPCLNGGYCNATTGTSFICTCPPDWTGVICESANYNESMACGTTLDWSQYDAANGFTRLCYFWADNIEGRYTECRFTIRGIPLYDNYTGLMKAGGNFGCLVSQNYPEDLPITSRISCENDYQQDVTLSNYTESSRIMVCLRYPYEGQPGRK